MALFANSLRCNGASAAEGRPSVIGATGKRRLVTAHTLYRHSRKQAKPVIRLQTQESNRPLRENSVLQR